MKAGNNSARSFDEAGSATITPNWLLTPKCTELASSCQARQIKTANLKLIQSSTKHTDTQGAQ